ncbi:nicotine blue oxidoreductase [Paenarthrobacter nitroguajacolicus]|uniref:nicotine blue oxidoreductase n=1 Tax=Paenarthrobacter nitroguajacolicus TaxID=211146 RepID=UPI00341A4783
MTSTAVRPANGTYMLKRARNRVSLKDWNEVKTTGVLLAAGAGTRLGRGPKALLRLRGRPLVEIIAAKLLSGGCSDVLVVLGSDAAAVRARARLDSYQTLVNPEWHLGMGSSYLIGDDAARTDDHLLVALVDQPGLTEDTVRRLMSEHRPGRITAAAYTEPRGGTQLLRGHPMLIDVQLREAVSSTVVGDAGARAFIRDNPGLLDLVDCSDESTGEDIDTEEQLRRLLPAGSASSS